MPLSQVVGVRPDVEGEGGLASAVGKQLRVSDELLDGDENGDILVFKTAISAKEVLARLERARG